MPPHARDLWIFLKSTLLIGHTCGLRETSPENRSRRLCVDKCEGARRLHPSCDATHAGSLERAPAVRPIHLAIYNARAASSKPPVCPAETTPIPTRQPNEHQEGSEEHRHQQPNPELEQLRAQLRLLV